MSSEFHKKHSVKILLNLFGGLPPTLRGWKSQAQEAVTDLRVDLQPFVSVTAHLTHFISLNCFLISWGQQRGRSVFRASCVSKRWTLSFYFIIHLSWKGRFPLEEWECRFGGSRDPSWVAALLFASHVTLENSLTLSEPRFPASVSIKDWTIFPKILSVLKWYIF